MSRRTFWNAYVRPGWTKKCILVGILAGLAFGLLEAFAASLRDPDVWAGFKLHFFQVGLGWPLLGGACGYILAKRLEKRWERRLERRRAEGRCVVCGYNLTGNVSGVCPECGEKI